MSKKNNCILVIEDEALLLQAIIKKLELNGYESVSATSGEQALDYLNNLEELPDLIWLDYYLGDMNGLEFMNTIKENEQWKDIPVVVVSNSASDEKIHSMLALGAQKYLLKAQHRLDSIVEMIGKFIDDDKKDQQAD